MSGEDKATFKVTESPEEAAVSSYVARELKLDSGKDVWTKAVGSKTEISFSDAVLANNTPAQISYDLGVALGGVIGQDDPLGRKFTTLQTVDELQVLARSSEGKRPLDVVETPEEAELTRRVGIILNFQNNGLDPAEYVWTKAIGSKTEIHVSEAVLATIPSRSIGGTLTIQLGATLTQNTSQQGCWTANRPIDTLLDRTAKVSKSWPEGRSER